MIHFLLLMLIITSVSYTMEVEMEVTKDYQECKNSVNFTIENAYGEDVCLE